MTGLEVLRRELRLPAEWRLGAGGLVRFAPSQPALLELGGFRDPGHYLCHSIDPVFAVTLLDRHGRLIETKAVEREWNPSCLELKYRLAETLITERRGVLTLDSFVSQWTFSHVGATSRQFWIVLWTRRPDGLGGRHVTELEANPQGISFQEAAESGAEPRWGCALGASFDADSWSINSAAGAPSVLDWRYSPFFDLMAPGGLPGHLRAESSSPSHLYLALAYPIEVAPGERLAIHFAAAFGPDVEQARSNLEQVVAMNDPMQHSEEDWASWFEEVPSFTCSDPRLQRAYWYRWAARRIFSRAEWPRAAARQAVLERPWEDVAGNVIELAWQHDSETALIEAKALLEQAEPTRAPVAHALRRLLSIHPEPDFSAEVATWLRLQRARVGDGLVPAVMQPPWSSGKPPVSLVESVFAIDLAQLVDAMDSGRARDFSATIDRAFWDEEARFYLQALPETCGGRRIRSAWGFLPLLVQPQTDSRRRDLLEALSDPDAFWCRYPVPTLARNDRDFDAEGNWGNERLATPFHGRAWGMVNSLVIDAWGREVEKASAVERRALADLLSRMVEVVFPEGDIDRPMTFEHWHPLTGRAAHFLEPQGPPGGWLLDAILRYVAGLRPEIDGRIIVDPLPYRLEWFALSRAYVGDHEIEVEWDERAGLTLRIDDESAGHAPVGQSLTFHLSDAVAVNLEPVDL